MSKFLARLLRHAPESAGLALDREGWADLGEVLEAARQRGLAHGVEDLRRVVAENEKRRFAISDGRIRAVQGHSSSMVDLCYEPVVPPTVLYHGTAERNLDSIFAEGLRPARRHYVHLSLDPAVAREVGRRHGRPVVLEVAAGRLHASGQAFHRAENGVWLTAAVHPSYLALPDTFA